MKELLKTLLMQTALWKGKERGSKVFYYHDVHLSSKPKTPMSTPLELFEDHVSLLKKEGFGIVRKIRNPENEAMITFDDGFSGLYENFGFFVENDIPVTVFLIVDRIGRSPYLTKSQILELAGSGLVSFGSHTLSHRNLDEVGPDLTSELFDSKKRLEDLLGKEVDSLCYPRGRFNIPIADRAKEAGYLEQYSCLPGNFFDEVFPGVIRRNFVQHATPREFHAWLYGGGKVFEKRFRKMHIRPDS